MAPRMSLRTQRSGVRSTGGWARAISADSFSKLEVQSTMEPIWGSLSSLPRNSVATTLSVFVHWEKHR